MTKVIRWTHASGEVKEYEGIRAFADGLGVRYFTAYRYIRYGFTSDSDIQKSPQPQAVILEKHPPRSTEEMRAYWREMQAKSRAKTRGKS